MGAHLVVGDSAATGSFRDLPPGRPRRYVLSMTDGISPLQFQESEGVDDWRVLSEGAIAYFRTGSFAESVSFVAAIGQLADIEDHQPDVDVRRDGVTVRLITMADDWFGVSARDVVLARRISAVAQAQGVSADPSAVQSMLIVPGAPVTAEVMPFWRAVLGYEPRADSPAEDLVDPHGRGPSFWFETMDAPRPDGGGAIHIGVWVAPDQAEARVAAALAAGGHLVRDEFAPSWWTLADAAGNEADIGTIMGRD
jgi:4a-hydroxytetrahydrobiopterin dehydratase